MSGNQPTCMRSAASMLFLTTIGLLLVACSSGTPAPAGMAAQTSSAAPSSGAAAASFHTVLITGFKFQPADLTVNVGDTVEWKNADNMPHNATARDKEFDSGNLKNGMSWKFVAKQKGTYDYLCTLHPNMKAKLVVR